MNERANHHAEYVSARAQAELSHLDVRAMKRLRKKVRGLVMKDLQRRAITGGESPFKRGGQV